MSAVAVLTSSDLTVEPGQEVVVDVTVRNTGTVVDEFTAEVLGDAAPWCVVEPSVLALYPGAEGTVSVRVAPPRSSAVPPGAVPLAVRLTSAEDPGGSVVEEAVVHVGAFADLSAELLPKTSRARGRRWGRHEVALDNRGNLAVEVRLTPVDVDGSAEVVVAAPLTTVLPGEAAFVRLSVRGRTSTWRGPSSTRPFQVFAEPGTAPPVALQGSLLQEPVLPRWLPKLLAALLALLLALVALWFAVLRPVVEDYAEEAGAQAGQQAGAQAGEEAGQQAGEQAGAQAGKEAVQAALPGGGAGGGAGGGGGATEPTAAPSAGPTSGTGTAVGSIDPLGDPFAVRLASGRTRYTVPAERVFSLTDLVFQNPQGDSGTIVLRRGDDVLFQQRLDNFRDLDQHFVAPLVGQAGDVFSVRVTCDTPGGGATACSAAVLLSGFSRTVQAES